MNDHISNLIQRYLYPDQIVFGGIFNPNIKLSHPMQLTKSSPQAQQNDELVIYVKIKSMLSMMEGNHPPLFKSAVVGGQRPQSQEEDYEDQDDDYGVGYEDQDQYDGYDDEMYLMEKDYEDYFQDQYDDEENPIMALGHSAGALPKIKDYNLNQKKIPKHKSHITHPTHTLSKLTHSQQLPSKKQQGLGQILGINFANNEDLFGSKANIPNKTISNQTKSKKQPQTKKIQNNDQEDEDWQTQSQEQVQQNKPK